MNGGGLLLEPVLRPVVGAARIGPPQTGLRIEIEDDCQVGHRAVDRHALQRGHEPRIEIAARALIDAGRIHEAVDQHDLCAFERGPDHLLDMIVARGGKKQRLHGRPEALDGGLVEKHMAHGLGAGRAAGLPRDGDPMAAPAQPFGEQGDLGRLSDPLPALERDETAATGADFPGGGRLVGGAHLSIQPSASSISASSA